MFRHIEHRKASEVPTHFLLQFANPLPQAQTDNLDNHSVPADQLWEEMKAIGMRNPLILRICLKAKTVRLETGNQRISLFEKHGIEAVPTVIELVSTPIGDKLNGLQIYTLREEHFRIEHLYNSKSQICHPSLAIRMGAHLSH